jgi:hypothetical protein
MMNYLITSSRLIVGSVFFLALSLMTSCEKESFTPAPTPATTVYANVAEAEHALKDKAYVQEAAFNFEIEKNYCTLEGVSLSVNIDRPEAYAFKWSIDGNHGGHNSYSPACVCGNSATVFITRLSDGMSLRQAIELPSCGSDYK